LSAAGGGDRRPVALVTGGARRVGRAIALELASAGLDCVLTYNTSAEQADQLVHELREAHGVRAWAIRADLADPDAAAAACARALADAGRLDVLVHNASAYAPFPLAHQEAPPGSWPVDGEHALRMYAINAASPLVITARLADALRASPLDGGGAVVALADVHAMGRPRARFSGYTMSKAALVELVRSLARDLAPAVRVNAVAPGVVAWPEQGYESDPDAQRRYLSRVPLGRQGTPGDAARAVRWLALEATYTTGEVIRLDGGRSLV